MLSQTIEKVRPRKVPGLESEENEKIMDGPSLSRLSLEVKRTPLIKLKKRFIQKSSEMYSFIKGGNLFKYDSTTLLCDEEKEQQRLQKSESRYS